MAHEEHKLFLELLEENRQHNHRIEQLIEHTERKIMSAITDFATANQASLDAISASLDGITAGITALDTLITNLQNSPGTLSPSDQAALDAIQASSASLVAKAAAISVTPPPTP